MGAAPPHEFGRMGLDALAAIAAAQKRAPVERWDPPHCGDSAMRIDRDGGWHHEGRPISRPEMVRLFASILRCEPDGRHVLVTPVEKLDIEVEDCPFVAVEAKSEGEGRERRIAFRLNTDEIVVAGPEHALRVEPGPRPLLAVRAALYARLARPVYYELAGAALEEGAQPTGLWSDGWFFPLEPA